MNIRKELMYNDTIADFLTRLRNATMAGLEEVPVRPSKSVLSIAQILKSEGFISAINTDEDQLTVSLDKDWPITHIKRLSKPGVRIYVKTTEIPRPRGGTGVVIISTPKGHLTGSQARKQKVGGELVCEVW
ncbi:MAG: 30S ribosomal protein S8 [bacterium]|nr:30S ribosomal protein S8 [bacterium]